jgi:hypothetical protein
MLENDFGQKDWSKSDTYYLITDDGLKITTHNENTEIKYGLYDKDMNMMAISTEDLYNYLITNCKNR